MADSPPFPVLCDRCRAEGFAGEAEFAELADLGDLLDFEPVPRRVERADGWTAEVQRAFIAALAVTGSDRQAAAIVGRAQYGYIARRDGLERAEAIDKRLRAACEKLTDFPNRGSPHDELAPGLRSVPFEGRATIYYRVTSATVDIMHIAWAGRDAGGIFNP